VVAPYTAPTYNAVLGMAGAIVTEQGGLLCHAAVIARELGLPAVIGAQGAMDIPDGAPVEVDPSAGRVRVHAG
jgi:pyruvate,water dikinase